MYITGVLIAVLIILYGMHKQHQHSVKYPDSYNDAGFPWFMIGTTIGIALLPILFISIDEHVSDLGKVKAQHLLIKVQKERISNLSKLIQKNTAHGKQSNQFLFNRDSPIKTIVDQLALAEQNLAKSKTSLAKARRSIEARKVGPMWFVVSIYGER